MKNKEVELIEPVQMNIYQSSNSRRDLSRLYFGDEPWVQERQQMKDKQAYISVFVAYLSFPSSS